MSDKLSMELPAEIVERAVRDKITSAIARELGDPAEIIRRQVSAVLDLKVNIKGEIGSYSSENKYTFIEAQAGKLIREAAKEALVEFFNENKAKIKECVKKEVAKSPSKMAKVFMDGITSGLTATYGSKIEIVFENKDRDY